MTDDDVDVVIDENTELSDEVPTPSEGDDAGDQEGDRDESSPNREAAKYRRRLRETEAERDAYLDQLNGLRRQMIDAHLEGMRIRPEGFWAGGVNLGDMLDDAGLVDFDAVTATAREVAERLGLGPRLKPSPTAGAMGPAKRDPQTAWEQAFRL